MVRFEAESYVYEFSKGLSLLLPFHLEILEKMMMMMMMMIVHVDEG